MTSRAEYETWTEDQLIDHSAWLYEQYLQGEDYLDDIHTIADVLRAKKNPGATPPGV